MANRMLTAGVILIAAGAVGMATARGTAPGNWPQSLKHGSMMTARTWEGNRSWSHPHGYGWAEEPRAATADALTLEIDLTDFAFSPSRLEISSAVNIRVENGGRLPHDLSIPALGFRLRVAPGRSAEAFLLLPPPGEYQIVCSVPGHADAGMVGTLTVKR